MPRNKAIPDSQGGGIERDYGWCEFVATDNYRKNCANIWGIKCIRCRKEEVEEEYTMCKKCREAVNDTD